jgi:hypothetical protein
MNRIEQPCAGIDRRPSFRKADILTYQRVTPQALSLG